MPTYIDESGDTGTKQGSAPYFRLAAVFFERPEHRDEFSETLRILRSKLGLPQGFEFHFARIGHRLRTEFFRAVVATPFFFAVSSFNKRTTSRARLDKRRIHTETARRLIRCLETQYLLVEERLVSSQGLREGVVFDQSDDHVFERVLKDELKRLTTARACGRKLVGGLRSGKSKAEPGLQLVDMVCGAVGKYLEGQDDYYKQLDTRERKIEVIE